jgi:hypothetical protein
VHTEATVDTAAIETHEDAKLRGCLGRTVSLDGVIREKEGM